MTRGRSAQVLWDEQEVSPGNGRHDLAAYHRNAALLRIELTDMLQGAGFRLANRLIYPWEKAMSRATALLPLSAMLLLGGCAFTKATLDIGYTDTMATRGPLSTVTPRRIDAFAGQASGDRAHRLQAQHVRPPTSSPPSPFPTS
jgi:hypothetical protein